MNSKERVLCAADHRIPDRIPMTFDAELPVFEKLYRHFSISSKEELWDALHADTWFIGPVSRPGLVKELPDGEKEDAWGVRRRTAAYGEGDTAGEYTDVVHNPLGGEITSDDIEQLNWPKPGLSDFSAVRGKCEQQAHRALIGHAGLGVFFRASFIRGMDSLLMDMMAAPELAHALIDRITPYVIHQVKELMNAAGDLLDIYYIADDFCMQQAPMMPPHIFECFFHPYIKEIADIVHAHDCKFLFHCCGAVRPLLPMMIEAGVDMLEPIQVSAEGMDPEGLKRDFGNDLCFYGGVDLQQILCKGTQEQVADEVKLLAAILGRGGGYILGPGHTYIQADAPLENILTMYETAYTL